MNERIKELAEKQGFTGPNYLLSSQELEKFAELIVRECIDVIGEENYAMLTGKAYCTQLKRHFGVDE